jgi:sulfoxide reductase heme-binding subunit YedZ
VLRFLCLTLAVTPLRQAGWHALARCAACWGCSRSSTACCTSCALPGSTWGWTWPHREADIPKRPFILVGTLALLLMLPLAATSFNRAIKALGAARWQRLHQAVYAIGLLGLLHFFWMRSRQERLRRVVGLRGGDRRAAGLAPVRQALRRRAASRPPGARATS